MSLFLNWKINFQRKWSLSCLRPQLIAFDCYFCLRNCARPPYINAHCSVVSKIMLVFSLFETIICLFLFSSEDLKETQNKTFIYWIATIAICNIEFHEWPIEMQHLKISKCQFTWFRYTIQCKISPNWSNSVIVVCVVCLLLFCCSCLETWQSTWRAWARTCRCRFSVHVRTRARSNFLVCNFRRCVNAYAYNEKWGLFLCNDWWWTTSAKQK